MKVKEIIPGCGKVATVLLSNGEAFTTKQRLIEKSGLGEGSVLEIVKTGKGSYLAFSGYILN